jgi:hypothetical protein
MGCFHAHTDFCAIPSSAWSIIRFILLSYCFCLLALVLSIFYCRYYYFHSAFYYLLFLLYFFSFLLFVVVMLVVGFLLFIVSLFIVQLGHLLFRL